MSQRPELSQALEGTAFLSFYDLKRELSIAKLLAGRKDGQHDHGGYPSQTA